MMADKLAFIGLSDDFKIGLLEGGVLTGEFSFNVGGSALSDDPTIINDANGVGVFGFLEVVGSEKDGDFVLKANFVEIVPEGFARQGIKTRSGFVEKEDGGFVH